MAEVAQAVVAPVTEPPPVIAPQTVLPTRAGLRWRYGALAGVSVLLAALLCGFLVWRPAAEVPRLSMVVLPFRSLSADHAQHYLADAITDDLISDLAHVTQSTVIARESSAAVKDQAPEEIGRSLHVRYIIRGPTAWLNHFDEYREQIACSFLKKEPQNFCGVRCGRACLNY